MPSGKTKEREARKAQEIAEIGPKDRERLHGSMNKSGSSAGKRAAKQPDHASGRRDGDPRGSTSRARTSVSGTKRKGAPGAGPAEPTPTTAKKQAKRATVARAEEKQSVAGKAGTSRTRRNDPETRFNSKETKNSRSKSKHFT